MRETYIVAPGRMAGCTRDREEELIKQGAITLRVQLEHLGYMCACRALGGDPGRAADHSNKDWDKKVNYACVTDLLSPRDTVYVCVCMCDQV